MLKVEIFTRIMSLNLDSKETILVAGEHGKLEAYKGNKAVNNFGVSVQGSGSWVEGKIHGSLESYDYKAIYEVYNLKTTESASYWFVNYSKGTSRDELKKVFEDSKTVKANYDLKFKIQGNDYGINAVYITYEVIRLTMNGVTKDFVVNNSASSGAKLPSGESYPGGFEAVD